jgi:hypothetical protein
MRGSGVTCRFNAPPQQWGPEKRDDLPDGLSVGACKALDTMFSVKNVLCCTMIQSLANAASPLREAVTLFSTACEQGYVAPPTIHSIVSYANKLGLASK